MEDSTQFPRYYVQGESVRGEPRVYWVEKRGMIWRNKRVTECTTDRRQAERWCNRLLASKPLSARSLGE